MTMRVKWGALLLVSVGVLALSGADVHAQAGRARVLEGNRLYAEGRFAEAHQKYLEGLAEAPESSVIPFNDGNALYQDTDYQRAMEAYQRAIESGDPALAASAWYNLGNALYRQQQLEESLGAYKQALRLNPRDPDAKHNLERVLEEMQNEDDPSEDGQDSENQDHEQDPQDQEQDPQEGDQDEPEQDEQDDSQEPDDAGDDEQEQDARPQPQPGEMTAEEAERLLDAVDEDPGDVNRKPPPGRGRRPRKPW